MQKERAFAARGNFNLTLSISLNHSKRKIQMCCAVIFFSVILFELYIEMFKHMARSLCPHRAMLKAMVPTN